MLKEHRRCVMSIRELRQRAGMSQARLAERIGLDQSGVSRIERDRLGHSTVKRTERYAHLAPENVRAAVAVLDSTESQSSHIDETGRHEKSRESGLTA